MKRIFFIFVYSIYLTSAFSQWTWQNPLPQGAYFSDVWSFANNCAIAVGNEGKIMRTTNAGKSWETYSLEQSCILYGVHFSDGLHGWVVGKDGKAFRTTDAGATWQYVDLNTTTTLNSVQFISPAAGWIVGNRGLVLFTDDGGETWQGLPVPTKRANLRDVFFFDEKTGWVAGSRFYLADG